MIKNFKEFLNEVIVPVKDNKFISEFEESMNEGRKLGGPAGLSKEETLKVAEIVAKAISKVDKAKVTVNKRTLEPDSFDLDFDGEEFAGGSYNIYDNGEVRNEALPGSPVYAMKDSTLDQAIALFKKNNKKHIKIYEDFLNKSKAVNENVIPDQLKTWFDQKGYRFQKKGDDYVISNSSLDADERSDNGAQEKIAILNKIKSAGGHARMDGAHKHQVYFNFNLKYK